MAVQHCTFIQISGYFIRTREFEMSNAIAEVTEAQELTRILVEQEARRRGTKEKAHVHVARAVGAAPGTVENIMRGRLKRVSGWLRDALRARVIRELEAEVVRLQHEIAVLRQAGVDPRSNEMAAVRADLSAVLAALGLDRKKR
jgi:hypothetical protein